MRVTILYTIRDSGLTAIQDAVFDEALRKRRNSRSMRDRVFIRCARELTAGARSQLLSDLPDVDRLVSRVAACFEPEATGE